MLKNLKMGNRIAIMILALFIGSFAVIISTGMAIYINELNKNLKLETGITADNSIKQIESYMNEAVLTGTTLAQSFSGYQNLPVNQRRTILSEMMKSVLENKTNYLSVWAVWELNKLDGMDEKYCNTPGNSDAGRFNATWSRNNGKMILNTDTEENLLKADYYTIIKASHEETILKPYYYSYTGNDADAVLETSVISPVMVNGSYVGEVGIDISLEMIHEILSRNKPYGSGYTFLLNQDGLIVSHPLTNWINQSIADVNPEYNSKFHIAENIKTGKEFNTRQLSEIDKNLVDMTYIPLEIGISQKPWFLAIAIPVKETEGKQNQMILFMLILMAGIISLLSFILFKIVKTFVKPIVNISGFLKNASMGDADLTQRLKFKSGDEIGVLAESFNGFLRKLNSDMIQVETTSEKIQQSTIQSNEIMNGSASNFSVIASSIQLIEAHAERSTSGIEELTATIEEMSRNIDSIMQNMVRQAASVEEGASSIEEMVRNIENTASMSKKTQAISNNLNKVAVDGGTAVKASVQSIQEVSNYSQQILKLLGLISNIAKQTNLLAMNAAIEAAHAGDAGKGFAIVADEIRRLSEDTNKNARDIGEVVGSIVAKIDDSVRLSEKAGTGLDMITAYSQQNVQIISQLTIAMEEQSNGAEEVLKSTQELVKITEEVKMSMQDQSMATADFGSAIRDLRDMALENNEGVKLHQENMESLMQSFNKTRDIIAENQAQVNSLAALVGRFKLNKNEENETTAIRLVE